MASMHFTEQQTIPSTWRMLIFGGVTLMMGFIAFMVFQTEWNTMPATEKPFLLTLLIGPLATLILFIIRLDVRITSGTVEYKVHPFRKNFKVIPFSKITRIELMKPKGFRSFQGIGTHKSLNQTEMNFGGKYMVVLTMNKGRILSFTTNKPQELKSFLENLSEGAPIVKIEV
ncbi:MAG: hypothetical protein NTV01_04190 [Bacteroidia bacterium]|nr:hypothetical protein [Bacteroidia bacterium]